MSVVRPETKGDETGIRRINDQAFGQKEEGELVDKLRNRGALTLSLVAVAGSQVVGHIAFSPVEIESKGSSFTAITLAPMAVLPGYQRKGIGSQLVRAGLEGCRRLGYELLFVLGHPDLHTTIVGTANLSHLANNVAVAQKGPLPEDLREEAKRRIRAATV